MTGTGGDPGEGPDPEARGEGSDSPGDEGPGPDRIEGPGSDRSEGPDPDGGAGPLGAAWGGAPDEATDPDREGGSSERSAGSGPLPRAEEVQERGAGPDVGPADVSTIDRITIVLQEHKSIFTVALLLYAFLGMPWLVSEGFELPAYLIGAAFLGGVVLVTVANAHEARATLNRQDERRGF